MSSRLINLVVEFVNNYQHIDLANAINFVCIELRSILIPKPHIHSNTIFLALKFR
jgi:hypothetical protein